LLFCKLLILSTDFLPGSSLGGCEELPSQKQYEQLAERGSVMN